MAGETKAEVYEDLGDDGENCWFVKYRIEGGHEQTMVLDAETLDDALFEAASITGLPQESIEH